MCESSDGESIVGMGYSVETRHFKTNETNSEWHATEVGDFTNCQEMVIDY